MSYCTLPRYTPMRKKRATPRRGEPSPAEVSELRKQVYDRAGGLCELHLDKRCQAGVLPFEGSVFERAHMVHLKAKRRFGTALDRLALGCFHCHIEISHGKGVKLPESYAALQQQRGMRP